ncbi:extracellular solute-binding protein [Paenibacillus piri]|uniref:Extracellular solute-binding protein n=1 Tax=Paenibacillus piri TaxID=2547395 RepID=A0A4R5KKE1_9BACL|nr:extracellular solute-binding protein [Paenibacillus piri]TDF95926.1 extracellular solute-binding protein [Paenibacillus piri]
MKMNKFRMVWLPVLSILMVLVSACGQSSNQQASNAAGGSPKAQEASEPSYNGEKLVVGVWGGAQAEAVTKFVVKPLEAKGAKIELVLGGTGDRVAKLYAEKGNPSMDVAFLNIYEAKHAIQDGVAQEVDPDLPNFKSLYPVAQQGGYGFSLMAMGIAYNKELVKEPIKDWKDLWRPEFKGKVAFPSYPGFEGDSLVSMAGKAFGRTEKDDRANFDKLKELKPVPLVYSNLDELFLEMKNGTVLAVPFFNSYVNQYIAKGFPVEFVYPKDPGPVLAKNTIVIAKGTKHEKLAKEFVNMCLGKEIQEYYAKELFFGPVNKEVKVADDVAAKIVYGEEKVNQLKSLDWDFIISKRPEWAQIWAKEILGK